MDLTPEQLGAFDLIERKRNMFITSRGAGCGKTYLLKRIIDKYKHNMKIAVTASTGIAAVLLNGMTIHSWAGIGLGNKSVNTMYSKIKSKKNTFKRWRDVDMIIIDEISLISPELFDKLEELARLIRENEESFGGIQVIVCGDWLQLPTIDSDSYAFDALAWDKCITDVVYLKQIQRQNDKTFQDILNEVRIGRITKKVKEVIRARVDANLDNEYGIVPTKLYSLNSNVDSINTQNLEKLIRQKGATKHTYRVKWVTNKEKVPKNLDDYFNIKTTNQDKAEKPKEDINTDYIKMCNAVENLELCVDAQVMLLSNLDKDQHLVNGSRGVVTGFTQGGHPIVKFLNGVTEVIEYKKWEIEFDSKLIGYYEQIPLKLAYATSIHKSQGSTLDYVELDLKNIFELSQAYVGLSRVTSLEGLSITGLDFKKFRVSTKALEFYNNLEKTQCSM